MKKRRQHYVWGYYLKSWCTDGKLYCLQGGTIFPTSVQNVANKRDFYRLRELSINDLAFIKEIAIDPSAPHLQEANSCWLRWFNLVFDLKRVADSRGIRDQELDEQANLLINNLEEELHSNIESSSIKYINAILDGDISFLETDSDYIDFTYFVSVQYMRTRKQRDNMLALSDCIPDINEAVVNVLRHIHATNVSWALYRERKEIQVMLLENHSPVELITADQPVVNTYATYAPEREPVDELELYFPIAPTRAILITWRPEYQGLARLSLSERDALVYNRHIRHLKNSEARIISVSEGARVKSTNMRHHSSSNPKSSLFIGRNRYGPKDHTRFPGTTHVV